jgi:pimeloyl-ACP methyl ester carboxylesterase
MVPMRNLCLLLILAALGAAPTQQPAATLGLHVKPCILGKSKAAGLCGSFGVYEDRAANTGKIIQVQLAVIKARHPSNRAIVVVAGGPGESAVPYAPFLADGRFEKPLVQLRDTYNIMVIDDRGMGDSNGLQCDLTPQSNPASYFADLLPNDVITACRAKNAAHSNLADYNTNYATDDLNDMRAALGYSKLVLDGGSYGTFFSLIYLRRHPDSVESEVLNGVAPPGFVPLPGEPMGAQRALDDLIVKCKRDAACNKAFPNFGTEFTALIARLDKGPMPVQVQLKKGAAPVSVQMSKAVFVDHLRQTLYDPSAAALIPLAVDRASHGDTVYLGTLINVIAVGLNEDLTNGAWLSYTCAEFIPFLDQTAVDAAAAHSFAGDLRIEAQRRACTIWNVPAMPAEFNNPVQSDAPILMISGSDDPATPPRYAEQAAKYLPNARIALVQGAGHAAETPCTDALVLKFVRAHSAKGLNVDGCSAAFTVPKFMTSTKGVLDELNS